MYYSDCYGSGIDRTAPGFVIGTSESSEEEDDNVELQQTTTGC